MVLDGDDMQPRAELFIRAVEQTFQSRREELARHHCAFEFRSYA